MKPFELAILVPVLKRPQRVKPLLDSIFASTRVSFHVLFITNPFDAAEQRAIVSDQRATRINVEGGYAAKINAGVRAINAPLLFLGADDLKFHPRWFEAATAKLTDQVSVVGVNDLIPRRRGTHATHFLMTREYAERPTFDCGRGPLCERYDHSFIDNELVETAINRCTYDYAADSIVEHLHWMVKKSPVDETYERGARHYQRDFELFRQRRAALRR